MTGKKYLDVKDPSQPYKLAVYAIAIFGFAAFIWFWVIPTSGEILSLLREIVKNTAQ